MDDTLTFLCDYPAGATQPGSLNLLPPDHSTTGYILGTADSSSFRQIFPPVAAAQSSDLL